MGIVLKKIGNETNKISTRGFEPQISMNWKHPSMQNYQGTHQKKKHQDSVFAWRFQLAIAWYNLFKTPSQDPNGDLSFDI